MGAVSKIMRVKLSYSEDCMNWTTCSAEEDKQGSNSMIGIIFLSQVRSEQLPYNIFSFGKSHRTEVTH